MAAEFPRLRFKQAGASDEQLAQLEAHLDALPPGVQQALFEQWAGVSNVDLGTLIEISSHRAAKHTEPEQTEAPDVADEEEHTEPGQDAQKSGRSTSTTPPAGKPSPPSGD